MYEILKFDKSNNEAFEKSLQIRRKVFIDEQEISTELEYDDDSVNAKYLLILSTGIPMATCRWRLTKKGIKMERFAVIKAARNIGLGSILVKEVLKSILPCSQEIYIHSQEGAVGFYEKNDFVKTGPGFYEAGILHYFMKYSENKRI